jgi:hypothetical protein
MNENFNLASSEVYNQNAPSYEAVKNFDSYLVLLEKRDWKKHIKIKQNSNY